MQQPIDNINKILYDIHISNELNYNRKEVLRMKKIISAIICTALLCSLCACGILQQPDSNQQSQAEDTMPAETDTAVDANAYSLDIRNAYSMNSGGKKYILVEAKFKNGSSGNASFYDAYDMKAFQNGVELHQNNSWQCSKFDLKICASALQPGYETNIYMGFETNDITSAVDVECSSLKGGADVKSKLSIDSTNYETPTQTTTAAPQVVYVPTPTPAPPSNYYSSSSYGYTCHGRSMSSAAALMSSYEKSIVNQYANDPSDYARKIVNEQYAKHGYCFNDSRWHIMFYGYDH